MGLLPLFFLAGGLAGCGGEDDPLSAEDDLRTPTAIVELALEKDGTCTMRSPEPRVKYTRVVRLKNVGDAPIAAAIELWDDFGGMPAPEGGDIEPGKFVSVKMTTRWWVLEEDPESREWSTPILCKKGPRSSDEDMAEVGMVHVFR